MKYKEIITHLDDLKDLLSNKINGIEFQEIFSPLKKPLIGDWSDKRNFPVPQNNDGIGDRSGIYFITSDDDEVLYIGKATKGNIHERIWDHLRTPLARDDGWITFPKNRFYDNKENNYGTLIAEGNAKIGIIEVFPNRATSLAEVYLQTIFLPPLCKQIG